jgi:D-xylose 1-dehydrogenase (NADP+, D-xylono-1,5-lactone-forming)
MKTLMRPPFRFGILGVARIARGFAEGLRGSSLVEAVAVASRQSSRAESFAAELGLRRAYGNYQALLDDPEVDAIYVALPNSLHAEWSMAAARAGKHVLCEKPLAMSEDEGREMFRVADRAGVQLLEAFPFHFQPQTAAVERIINDGTIGTVRSIQAAFSFLLADATNVRWDAALGGGALRDVGCYPVSLCRLLLGQRPSTVWAWAHWSDGGVDTRLAGTLIYADGTLAQISCGFDAALHRAATIVGTAGAVQTDYLNSTDRVDAPVLDLKRGADWNAAWERLPVPRANGFCLEAEAFANMVTAADHSAFAARRSASLDTAATLSALLESARTGSVAPVPPAPAERR